jgi:hypothetical protein
MARFFSKLPPITLTDPQVTRVARQTEEEFRERRKFPRPQPELDVVEGNGGLTDWATFEEAVSEQKKS